MKMPGIYAMYALFMAVFGQTHVGIHLGLLFVNIVTIILIFLLGKRLFNSLAGAVASASFAILSLNPSTQGIFANAEHFVILFAIGGLLLLLHAIDSNHLKCFFWSGVLLGGAFIIKQHGIVFIIFATLYLLFNLWKRRPIMKSQRALICVLFLTGVAIPFVLTVLVFLLTGAFDKFWFWTFVYARKYVSLIPFDLNFFKQQILRIAGSSILIWSFAGVGLTALLWDKKIRSQSLFIGTFFIFSFLSICPGFYFRPHYFILLLPAIALLASIGVTSIGRSLSGINALTAKRGIAILLATIIIFYSIYQQRVFLFQLNPIEACRVTYGANPFPESLEIAKYIKKHTTKNDTVAVIGSEPQIYFYSNRHSATGYMYTYALMENHEFALKMQQEMIREVELARPKFLIFVNISTSWLLKPYSNELIFNWFEQYHKKYYDLVGIVDILSPEKTMYYWGDEALEYQPLSQYWLTVYQEKETTNSN